MAQNYDKSSKLVRGGGLGFPTQKKNFSTLGKTANAKTRKSEMFDKAVAKQSNISPNSSDAAQGFPTENKLFSTLGKPSTNKDYSSQVFEQSLVQNSTFSSTIGANTGLGATSPQGPSLQTNFQSTTIGVNTGVIASDDQLTGDTFYLLSENYNYERFILKTEDGDLILWIN